MLRTTFIYFPTYLQFLFANFIQSDILPVDCGRLNGERSEANKYRSIALCIAQISRNELFWQPTVVLNAGVCHTETAKYFNNEVLERIAEDKIPYVLINASKNGTLNASKASYLLVNYYEDCEAMTAFDLDVLEKNVKYLIVLDRYSVVCEQHFKGIGDVIRKYDMSVFIKSTTNEYNLYTYISDIDPETCQIVIKEPLKINTCSNGELTHHSTFPRKLPTNLKKCPFKVGIGSLYPFAMIENRSSLQTNDPLDPNRVKGMDFEMIKIMSNCLNATLDLYYIFKQEENPYINMEYLPLLINGTLEACAGGLYRIYGDVVEYSGTYASQTVMWIYYAERATRTWENMITSVNGLYLFIIFYLSYSIVWCLIRLFDKHAVSIRNTFLYSWGALVGTASLQDAKSLKQKILNIVYLNMCLHLSVYNSIQLYSFLTIQGPPEMFKTNDDIMKSGRTPYLRSLTKYFLKDDKYERFANTSTECAGFHDCAEVSLVRKGMTVFIQAYFYPFQAATAVNDEARMLRPVENLLTVYYEMIMRKDSHLVLKFQRITGWLFEAGITDKLFNEAIGLTVVGKAKTATQNMMGSSYACQAGCKMSLQQFSGVFYVWSIGCAAAFCIFIIEILMKRGNSMN